MLFLLKASLTQNGPKILPKTVVCQFTVFARRACRQWADVAGTRDRSGFSPGGGCHHSPLPLGSTSIHISWYHWLLSGSVVTCKLRPAAQIWGVELGLCWGHETPDL